jgi:hypothetical protein
MHNKRAQEARSDVRVSSYTAIQSLIPALLAACFTLVYWLAYFPTLKLEAICSSEMSVDFHRTTRCYIPEDIIILKGPIPYESRSRIRLGSGSNEPNSSVCVGRHEPGSAESGWARQGLRWGSARRRLAIGSYVCGCSRASLAYPHCHTHRQ